MSLEMLGPMYSCPLVVFFFFSPCSETDCTFIYQPQSVLFVPRFCHVLEMTVCWLSAVNKSVFKCLRPFVSLLKSEKVFVFFVYVNVECPPKTKCYSFYNNQRANTRMIAWCPARVSGSLVTRLWVTVRLQKCCGTIRAPFTERFIYRAVSHSCCVSLASLLYSGERTGGISEDQYSVF